MSGTLAFGGRRAKNLLHLVQIRVFQAHCLARNFPGAVRRIPSELHFSDNGARALKNSNASKTLVDDIPSAGIQGNSSKEAFGDPHPPNRCQIVTSVHAAAPCPPCVADLAQIYHVPSAFVVGLRACRTSTPAAPEARMRRASRPPAAPA